MYFCFVALLTSTLLVNQGKTTDLRPVGKSELEGEWALIVWDFKGYWHTAAEGKIGDHYRDLRFTFTADRMKIKLREGGQRLRLGWDGCDFSYKIDPTKSPKEIDSDWGRRGIYALRGDRLVICLSRDDAKRPDTFEVKPKGADELLLLERVKK